MYEETKDRVSVLLENSRNEKSLELTCVDSSKLPVHVDGVRAVFMPGSMKRSPTQVYIINDCRHFLNMSGVLCITHMVVCYPSHPLLNHSVYELVGRLPLTGVIN